jgi:hypothetical protein
MCTRPEPSCRSTSASAKALIAALAAFVQAALFLSAALLTAPLRRFWPSTWQHRPAGLAHVGVQVHLGEPRGVAELEAAIWKTLERAVLTWDPLPLPVDRVVVAAGFPAAGRADIYDDFLGVARENGGGSATERHRRVVVSLGVRDGGRDLDAWEIAGALAAQIQALVDVESRQLKSIAQPVLVHETGTASTPRLPRPAPAASQDSNGATASGRDAIRETSTAMTPTEALPAQGVPSLADLLATVQQGQPLVAAGPTPNGTHP